MNLERSVPWAAALAIATVGGSLVAACLMPFVALAAMAASTLPRREGVATMLVAWAANQLLGFTLLGYPLDAATQGWGVAIGVAALAAYGVIATVIARSNALLPLLGAAVLGFIAYELVLYAYGAAGGGTGAFTQAIVLLLARNEVLWLAGLLVVRAAVLRLAPGWAPSLRAAA
ncbi:hypothetical protein P6144_03570 [Sphingomonas sp. HITSZ_GF]|uniref:hypothetical protein n=1 Tax=Sphingomonas sp. HITSZ_GF TaxID=3037247 RepID=UPI00240DB4C1|nr:hypothetical protein [Sphingomonas sp. HITSZ_GF]MDG2532713.1 hypothetical protein [Sphingomonas sp. HITSZ_GF]